VVQLGGTSADEDGRYMLGDDALACLRDLKRWLKLYDEKLNRLDVARCLAEAKLVTGDLLPILASWPEDGKNDKLKARVALACLELLVPLTWPLEHGGEMTVNHHRHTPYLQQSQVLYKAGILSWDTCSILRQAVRIGLPSIALPKDDRSQRDEGIIKLLLYFLRNVVVTRQIPNLPSQGLEMEVDRSATIEAFRQQDVFALLLTICSNIGDDFNLHDVIVLEILFNMIKGIDVRKLWMTSRQREQQTMTYLKSTLAAESDMHREAKKHAPTRHGRFGTMIWVKRQDEKMSAMSGQDNLASGSRALFNMDKSKKWDKPQQRQKDNHHTIHDFDRFEDITESATEKLRNFVEEFLDSGFNPLFTHLRRAIEREADRLLDVNYRQFFFCVSWFLEAERTRREAQQNESRRPANIASLEAESYSLVAAVLNQETFIMLERFMQASADNKEWQDLNASMRCFTQILLTVQDMANSPLDEDQEIAENIQNRIFYEEKNHDLIVRFVREFKDQGFGYLNACTELGHVFLRMLERYSKENVDLQIRSKRKRRKAKKDKKAQELDAAANADEDEASEMEDAVDAVQVSKERKFDFNRFAAKFVSQSSVNTYFHLLGYFKDLSIEQLKRAHRFFHRVAFKQDQAVLLYRVDIIALIYRIVKGPEGLNSSNTIYKEWTEFSRQLFKKMLKKLETRPELMVEMLFSKINSTLYYLEYGSEKQSISMTRTPAELEIKNANARDIKEQIAIVVTAMIKEEKLELVKWISDILGRAVGERKKFEDNAEKRRSELLLDASKTDEELLKINFDPGTPSYITVRALTEDVRIAMFKNAKLKLLMKLCSFEILGLEDALGATWMIPGQLTSAQLTEFKEAVDSTQSTPWTSDLPDEEAADLIRRARNIENTKYVDNEFDESGARRDHFIDDSEGDDDVEEFIFPDNIRSRKKALENIKAKRNRKRKRDSSEAGSDNELDDDAAAERRKKRKDANDERRRKIKSELYVRDSDDETDDEADKEFFKNEELLRKKQEENIRKQMALGIDQQQPVKKKAKVTKADAKEGDDDDVDENGDVVMGEDATATNSSQSQRILEDSDDENRNGGRETSETPISSPESRHNEGEKSSRGPMKELVNVPTRTEETSRKQGVLDDSDEEQIVSSMPRSRRMRTGFVVDSDEDE
jgi:replication fork protection complex subunit Tof1/Swi1